MSTPIIPETILRHIWQEQCFSHQHLATADGRTVRILSPGTPNTDAGPDFLNAHIVIGNTTFRGDVELHISAEEWLGHKHDRDPHYNSVILHVVLTAEPLSPPAQTASKRALPLLILHPFLDEKTHDALTTQETVHTIRPLACVDVNDDVPSSVIVTWLEKLGRERLELKVRRFEERLKQLVDESRRVLREPYPRYYGNPAEIPPPRKDYKRNDFMDKTLWEQLLYEGIMEALGYAKNQRAFLRLARSLRLETLRTFPFHDTSTMMGLLFGAASLLPSSTSIKDKSSRDYVAALKRTWRRYRPSFKGDVMSEGDWLFFRLRPQNFPTARLAALCFLLPKLFGEDAFRSLTKLMKDTTLSAKQRREKLHELFTFTPDWFWQTHYHFKAGSRSSTSRTSIALGTGRINDIIVNTLVPFMLLYARMFRDVNLTRSVRFLLRTIPPSQENAMTRIVRRDLLKHKLEFRTALQQQGALQLHRFFCSPLRCAECAVGQRTPLVERAHFTRENTAMSVRPAG